MATKTKTKRTTPAQSRRRRPRPADLRRSRGARFVKWCHANVVHGAGDLFGQPFILRADQQLFAYRWFEVDDDGEWWYERAYIEAPKGDGKTMLLAAIILFELLGPFAPDYPDIPVAAATQDQAMKDAGGIYRRLCDILTHENCPLGPFVDVGYDVIRRLDRPGQVRSVPAGTATGADGGLPTLYVADEVQDWKHAAADAHERNENSTTKRESPVGRSISASTPGAYAGDGSVGWRLHNYGLGISKGTIDDPRFLFESKAAPDDYRGKNDDGTYRLDDVELRRRAIECANVGASKRRVERLLRRYNEIPYHRFCRFHLGWWMEADGERWMDMAAYGECERDEDDDWRIPDGAEVVVMFDGSINDDATGLTVHDAAGNIEVGGVWEKPEAPIKWKVPRNEVDVALRRIMRTYTVKKMGMDPSGWRQEGIAWAAEYGEDVVLEYPPTDARMAPACEDLLAATIEGSVRFERHPALRDHIRNAVTKPTSKGDTIRKEHHESPRKIDLAVCAAAGNDLRLRFLVKQQEETQDRTMRSREGMKRRRRRRR